MHCESDVWFWVLLMRTLILVVCLTSHNIVLSRHPCSYYEDNMEEFSKPSQSELDELAAGVTLGSRWEIQRCLILMIELNNTSLHAHCGDHRYLENAASQYASL